MLTCRIKSRTKCKELKPLKKIVSRTRLWCLARYVLFAMIPIAFFVILYISTKISLTNLISANLTYKNSAIRSLCVYNIRYYT